MIIQLLGTVMVSSVFAARDLPMAYHIIFTQGKKDQPKTALLPIVLASIKFINCSFALCNEPSPFQAPMVKGLSHC